MLIKLNIDGELLELLKADAKENCRTNPQQIIYYLKQIYRGKMFEVSTTLEQEETTEEIDDDILNF